LGSNWCNSSQERIGAQMALAEAFAALGVERENSWRLAARVRILLAYPTPQSVEADAFWDDPDVRWLAGLNQSEGITYLNQEAFEELLWWLELPSLLAASLEPSETPVAAIETHLATHTTAAAKAGYDLDKFRAVRVAKPSELRRDNIKA
jgi:hypothetical protein